MLDYNYDSRGTWWIFTFGSWYEHSINIIISLLNGLMTS